MKPTPFLAVLPLLALLLVGCSANQDETDTITNIVVPPGEYRTTQSVSFPDSLYDQLSYEELTGTLSPGQGGIVGRYLSTWPKLCYIGLQVPPGAVQYQTDFSMRVPTYQSYMEHPSLYDQIIVRLEPGSTNFLELITVHVTWMPWLPVPDGMIYETGDVFHGYSTIALDAKTRRHSVTFQIDHFSDWETRPAPQK